MASSPKKHQMPKPSSASSKTFHIAGILTTVYGLDELSPESKSISCLWLLHPRLQTKETMEQTASRSINEWNKRPTSEKRVGLIAVAFDQRNHGSREVNAHANGAWRDGNVTHAQDMFRYLILLPCSRCSNLTFNQYLSWDSFRYQSVDGSS